MRTAFVGYVLADVSASDDRKQSGRIVFPYALAQGPKTQGFGSVAAELRPYAWCSATDVIPDFAFAMESWRIIEVGLTAATHYAALRAPKFGRWTVSCSGQHPSIFSA